MNTVKFDFDAWDDSKDLLLDRPGNALAFSIVNAGLDVGDTPEKGLRATDSTIGPTLDGVIGMLAGSLEWLRKFGMTPEELESKVRAFKKSKNGAVAQEFLLEEYRAITDISDPRNIQRFFDPNKVIG